METVAPRRRPLSFVLLGVIALMVVVAAVAFGWGSDDYAPVLPVADRTVPFCEVLISTAASSAKSSIDAGLGPSFGRGDSVIEKAITQSLSIQRGLLRDHRPGFLRSGAGYDAARNLFEAESTLCDLAISPRGSLVSFIAETERITSNYKSALSRARLDMPVEIGRAHV